jgi:glycosyltransferase involved in cell wall biosynthesis
MTLRTVFSILPKKTIAINALNSNSGGGKSIRDSYLKLLNASHLSERYVVIAAKGADLCFVTNPRIEILEMPRFYSRAILAPFVYRFVLGRVVDRIGADVVVNLGNLIVHTSAKQIYLFQWPYALDVHEKVWASMKPIDWLNRKTKLWLLRRDFHRPNIVIAQTDFIKSRLEERYGLKDVRMIAGAVTIDSDANGETHDFRLPQGVKLVCPAVYYPHKNLEILLDLAQLIKERRLEYRIVTTVNPDSEAAQRFVDAISSRRLADVIINIGQVPLHRMHSLYRQCQGLLMPTLLETFGIIYLEAMHHDLPVFTSDMWFAHSVCGEAAKYFDPFDAVDILYAIEEVMPNPDTKDALIEAGRRQLASFPSWEENFATYQQFIAELLADSGASN